MPIDFSQFGVHGALYTVGSLIIAWLLKDRSGIIAALREERERSTERDKEYLEFAKTSSPLLAKVGDLLEAIREERRGR